MAKKILLVDDEELVIRSIGKLLQKQGYDVVMANDGEDAITLAQKEFFDLIVLDVRMPGMNGIEVVKAIRRFQKQMSRKAIPEILITGYADEAMMKEAETLKVADCLYKPFDIRDFLTCVKKHLP
jgi:two-component system response regulator (stage 0 sporulation protein F)